MSPFPNPTTASQEEEADPGCISDLSTSSQPMQTAMLLDPGNSEGAIVLDAAVECKRGEIEAELHGYEHEDKTLADRAFRNVAQSEEAVETFIAGCDLYDKDQKRWLLPEEPSDEKVLLTPLAALIEAISVYFGLDKQRSVLQVHNTKVTHAEGSDNASQYPDVPRKEESSSSTQSDDHDSDYMPSDTDLSEFESEPGLKSSPDICIQAVVPNKKTESNFPYLECSHRYTPSYRMTVSAIDVETEKNFESRANHTQVAFYARQIFIQQGNRRIVNCFIITERHVQVCIFGRDGLHYSVKVNIHERPAVFVRYMLGALSLEANVVGFDPTVYYQEGKRYVRTRDSDGNEVRYTMVHERPVFYQRTIRGRGTTCWMAKNNDDENFIVKDAWKTLDRVPESVFLEKTADLPGVGKMRGSEPSMVKLSTLRLIDVGSMSAEIVPFFHDRELHRVVLDCYGPSLEGFKSKLELLYAYHDALLGYEALYKRGVLHRDISVNNILIGKPGATAPDRGVIIDLDMAIELDCTSNLRDIDSKAGTRAFQSINILGRYELLYVSTPHSYMDDLESFFYVLCWICCGYDGPGKRSADFGSIFAKWEDRRPQEGAFHKIVFLLHTLFRDQTYLVVTDYFGDNFLDLLDSLHGFFAHYVNIDRARGVKPDPPTIDKAFATILPFIDTAIAAVEAEESAKTEESSAATPSGPEDPEFTLLDAPQRCSRESPAPKRSHSEASGGESSSSTATKKLRSKRNVQYKPSALSSSSLADHGA